MSQHLMTSNCQLEHRPLEVNVYTASTQTGGHFLDLRIRGLGEAHLSGLSVADLENLYTQIGAYLSDLSVCDTFGVDTPIPYGVVHSDK